LLDKAFEKAKAVDESVSLKRFKCGYDIFSSHPARIGFITAISQKIYGKPGFKYDLIKVNDSEKETFSALEKFINNIDSMSSTELYEYLDIPSLDERINIPSGKVGEFERAYFLKVFYEFIDLLQSEDRLQSLSPVWLSYH
jgi:hypothetical protein